MADFDFAAIHARLKQIQGERAKAIEGTPDPDAPATPAAPSTVTGSGGGFTTPSGAPYQPNGQGGYIDYCGDCG